MNISAAICCLIIITYSSAVGCAEWNRWNRREDNKYWKGCAAKQLTIWHSYLSKCLFEEDSNQQQWELLMSKFTEKTLDCSNPPPALECRNSQPRTLERAYMIILPLIKARAEKYYRRSVYDERRPMAYIDKCIALINAQQIKRCLPHLYALSIQKKRVPCQRRYKAAATCTESLLASCSKGMSTSLAQIIIKLAKSARYIFHDRYVVPYAAFTLPYSYSRANTTEQWRSLKHSIRNFLSLVKGKKVFEKNVDERYSSLLSGASGQHNRPAPYNYGISKEPHYFNLPLKPPMRGRYFLPSHSDEECFHTPKHVHYKPYKYLNGRNQKWLLNFRNPFHPRYQQQYRTDMQTTAPYIPFNLKKPRYEIFFTLWPMITTLPSSQWSLSTTATTSTYDATTVESVRSFIKGQQTDKKPQLEVTSGDEQISLATTEPPSVNCFIIESITTSPGVEVVRTCDATRKTNLPQTKGAIDITTDLTETTTLMPISDQTKSKDHTDESKTSYSSDRKTAGKVAAKDHTSDSKTSDSSNRRTAGKVAAKNHSTDSKTSDSSDGFSIKGTAGQVTPKDYADDSKTSDSSDGKTAGKVAAKDHTSDSKTSDSSDAFSIKGTAGQFTPKDYADDSKASDFSKSKTAGKVSAKDRTSDSKTTGVLSTILNGVTLQTENSQRKPASSSKKSISKSGKTNYDHATYTQSISTEEISEHTSTASSNVNFQQKESRPSLTRTSTIGQQTYNMSYTLDESITNYSQYPTKEMESTTSSTIGRQQQKALYGLIQEPDETKKQSGFKQRPLDQLKSTLLALDDTTDVEDSGTVESGKQLKVEIGNRDNNQQYEAEEGGQMNQSKLDEIMSVLQKLLVLHSTTTAQSKL